MAVTNSRGVIDHPAYRHDRQRRLGTVPAAVLGEVHPHARRRLLERLDGAEVLPNTSGSQARAPSFIRSIIRAYLSGFSAGTQSGSLMRPILSQRSARPVVCSKRSNSTRTSAAAWPFPP